MESLEYRLPTEEVTPEEEEETTVNLNLAGGLLPSILNRVARRLPHTATVGEFLEELQKGVFDGDATLEDLLPLMLSCSTEDQDTGVPANFIRSISNSALRQIVSRKYLDHSGKPVYTGVQLWAGTEIRRRNGSCDYRVVRGTNENMGLTFALVTPTDGDPSFEICLTEVIPRVEPINDIERVENMEHNLRAFTADSLKNNQEHQKSLVEYLQLATGCSYLINPAIMDMFLDWCFWLKGKVKHYDDQAKAKGTVVDTLPPNTMGVAVHLRDGGVGLPYHARYTYPLEIQAQSTQRKNGYQ